MPSVSTATFEHLRKEAESGDIDAQFELGNCYYHGRGTDIAYRKAFKFYAKAAEGGHIEAQYRLGACYEFGKGTQIDQQKAFEQYTKSGKSGLTEAKYSIGRCYMVGNGTQVDILKAVEWFIQAAEEGDIKSQFNVGALYIRMEMYTDSIRWFKKAAENGYLDAQYNLAYAYENGKGIHVDIQQAYKWYVKAAEGGHFYSQAAVRMLNMPEMKGTYMINNNTYSGNDLIDEFLKTTPFVYWIPYERFRNIEFIAQGGFGTVYKATLSPFKIYKKDTLVALKCLNNSDKCDEEFFVEAKNYWSIRSGRVIHAYGLTRNSENGKLMLVMEWCVGELRNNLHSLHTYYNIYKKIYNIAVGLAEIHSCGLCHKDLHTGNILLGEAYIDIFISDLGLCELGNENNDTVLGVLPYIAPEVLHGEKYTQAADIYSLGIIMWVLLTRKQPFENMDWANKSELYWNKIEGKGQPDIPDWTPSWLTELMLNCWHSECTMRPSAKEIQDLMKSMLVIPSGNLPSVVFHSTESTERRSSQIYSVHRKSSKLFTI